MMAHGRSFSLFGGKKECLFGMYENKSVPKNGFWVRNPS